jgi:Taurine catabolism dioxygenase TauD, TfdA family
MEIQRYKLTINETTALTNMARRIGSISPDGELVSDVIKVLPPTSSVKSYYVDGNKFATDDRTLFNQLGSKLARYLLPRGATPLMIVEGIPLDLPASVLLLMGQMFGAIDEYYKEGAAIDSVMDRGTIESGRPRSSNNLPFPLHTDLSFSSVMPSVVYYLMVRQAHIGGTSTFCDIEDVLPLLSEEIVSCLRRPFRFPAPPHRPDSQPLDAPIIEFRNGKPAMLRYRGDALECLGTAEQQGSQRRALANFERAIRANTVSVKLASGNLAIWRNRQILHGRDRFEDGQTGGTETKRRLALRTYATTVC